MSILSTFSEGNFSYKILVLLLNTAGIGLPHQQFGILFSCIKFYLLCSFILLITGQIIMLKDCSSLHEYTITIAYIFSGIFLNVTTLVMHFKKRNLLNILEVVRISIPTVSASNPSTITADELFRQFFFSHGIIFYGVYVLACLSPYLFFPVSGNKMGEPNSLLLPAWYPWRYDTIMRYNLTVAMQFSCLFPLSVPCMLLIAFIVYFVIEIKVQYAILCHTVEQIKHLSEKDGELALDMIKKCIQHHQIIIKFVENFCSSYNWMFRANLFYSSANLALLMYGVILGERTVSAIMQQLSAFALVVSYLFLYCFIGEVLKTANKDFQTTLYDIQWFELPIKFRKVFLILQSLTQHEVNLRASYVAIASYKLFTSILKLAYSYFNVLLNAF